MKGQRTLIAIALMVGAFIFFYLAPGRELGCPLTAVFSQACEALTSTFAPTSESGLGLQATSKSQVHEMLIDPSGIEMIVIQAYLTDWQIRLSSDSQVKLVFRDEPNSEAPTIERFGQELSIRTGKQGHHKAELHLPQAFHGHLRLFNENGDFVIDEVANASKVKIVNYTGETLIRDGPIDEIDIKNSHGRTYFNPHDTSPGLAVLFESITGDFGLSLRTRLRFFKAETLSGRVDVYLPSDQSWNYQLDGLGFKVKGLPPDNSQFFVLGSRKGFWGAPPYSELEFKTLSGTLAFHLKVP